MMSPLNHPQIVQLLAEGSSSLDRWGDALSSQDADPGWGIFGLCAQAIIALCIVVHLFVSWRRRRMTVPAVLGYAATVATLMLLIYAAQRHDVVFIVGQFLNMLICLRLLTLTRRSAKKAQEEDVPGFPIVAPDSAERKLPTGKSSV